jgi:hypothetical protein
VHGDVAANAFAGGLETEAAVRNCGLCVKAGVALQTELAPFAAHQQHAVSAAMRVVTTDAAFYLYGGMFVHKGAALLDVTVHASFRSWLIQAGHILRAVRIVAIRTLHQPFGNAMVLRQCKLGLNREMAGKAQRGLRLLQETVVQPTGFLGQPGHLEEMRLRIAQISAAAVILYFLNQVRGVALIAGNAMSGVFGMFEKFLLFAGNVAAQTTRRVFIGGATKSEHRVVEQSFGGGGIVAMRGLNSVGVRLRGTMAAFTTVNIFLFREHQLRMRGLSILSGDFLVTGNAPLRPGKFTGWSRKLRSEGGDGRPLGGFR